MRKILLLPVLAGLALGGCADMNDSQRSAATGAAIGAASGALIGSFSGNAGWGALGGAAIGGAGGYLVSRNREARR